MKRLAQELSGWGARGSMAPLIFLKLSDFWKF